MRTRTVTTFLGLAIALIGLSACAAGEEESFNAADVAFAQGMIPHHRQATEMASLAADRTDNQQVLDLANRIAAAQKPEIDTMTSWLRAWDQDVPDDSMSSMDMEDMLGMLSPEQLAALEGSSDAAFDERFLTLMIAHHEGAITMAEIERTDGQNPEAQGLASQIKKEQAAEIAEMEKLLAR